MDSRGNMAVYLVFSLFSLEQRKRTKTIKLWIARIIIIITINIWCYCIINYLHSNLLTKLKRKLHEDTTVPSIKSIFFLSVILEIKPNTLYMPGKHTALRYMPNPFFLVLYRVWARGKFQWHKKAVLSFLRYQFTLPGQMMSCLWGWIFIWQ